MSTATKSVSERKIDVLRALHIYWFSKSDRQIATELGVSNRTVSKYRRQLEEKGSILPRLKSTHGAEACHRVVCTSAIQPWDENDDLYDPIKEDDPNFQSLVNDIRQNDILDEIVVSADGYIISGHRRYRAAEILKLQRVPVRIVPNVASTSTEFVRMVISFNKHRDKTTLQHMRENVASMSDTPSHTVYRYRKEASKINGVQAITLRGQKKRSRITEKLSLKKAIMTIVFLLRPYWPISDRKIFYELLNVTGLLRNDVRKTPFANTPECYDDVTNMITRMRLDGSIPFDCVADETRPVIEWDTHQSVGTFIEEELDDLFSEYFRDLQQSQPNHTEILAEKNTVANSIRPIAAKYTIPMTSGRGYASLPPRKAMVDRFEASGREHLIVIVVSDFDPEGEDIPNAFGLSLRDDFGIDENRLRIVKAALTQEQVESLDLHEGQLAKEESSRYAQFVEDHGEHCWELEAIPTETLQEIVEDALRSVMDMDAFEGELERQAKEQDELEQHRQRAGELLGEM